MRWTPAVEVDGRGRADQALFAVVVGSELGDSGSGWARRSKRTPTWSVFVYPEASLQLPGAVLVEAHDEWHTGPALPASGIYGHDLHKSQAVIYFAEYDVFGRATR